MKSSRFALAGFLALIIAFSVGCIYLVIQAGAWDFLEPSRLPITPIPSDQPFSTNQEPAAQPVDRGDLELLENTQIPSSDPVDLARRLQGKKVSTIAMPPREPYQVGAEQSFWVLDTQANNYFSVQAELRAITEHAYLWVEKGIRASDPDVGQLAQAFEQKVYPTNREFFGSEWTPGVDSDPHLYILYVRNIGQRIGGYFAANDEYPPGVLDFTNSHELFALNADTEPLNSDTALGTLAHEFQHMIHWNTDRNEELWLNEGFSDLAMYLNGYPPFGTVSLYTRDPDIQLDDWPVEPSLQSAHYGAAFLFVSYYLDRFGEQATRALVANPENGMTSIDQVLRANHISDAATGRVLQADDVFADWVLATYLQDPQVGDGRYTLKIAAQKPKTNPTEEIRRCPASTGGRDVSQYGVDYVLIRCKGNFTLRFEGTSTVNILPAEPHSGQYAFWSNRADASDTTLTRSFDFRSLSGPLTLTYWTWFNLEKDYDYLYLEASLDGENWEIQKTPSGTGEDPSGNSYGWGYNGASGQGDAPVWIQESVDLSQYAGKVVQLRFEYVTDEGVTTEGLLLDDIAIPQAGYAADFEADNGGWAPSGFARIRNKLPQTYRVSLVRHGQATTVEPVALSEQNSAEIPLEFSGDQPEVTLVVSGTARFTTEKAAYRLTIIPR